MSGKLIKTLSLTLCLMVFFATISPAYGFSYLVRPGDSLWKISQQFGVSIDSIKQANNISGTLIYAGQTLDIPQVRHIVQRGESLYLLARRYDTTINAIMQANNLTGTTIYVNQVLTIPRGETQQQAPTGQRLQVTDHEMNLLARAVYSEARGEPFAGQVAVAAVVINRVLHPEFPNTVAGVIFEPWAFTAVHDGQFWLTPNQTAYNAVREALAGNDPSRGALFYYNPVTATNQWIRTRPIITQIGRHVFAR